jgi:hypothetical protein
MRENGLRKETRSRDEGRFIQSEFLLLFRKQGDLETRRQGEGEKGRMGEGETRGERISNFQSLKTKIILRTKNHEPRTRNPKPLTSNL